MTPERQLLQRLVDLGGPCKFAANPALWAIAKLADEARELLAQPERPQWTDTPPTQAGWYWWRISETEPAPTMAHVLLDPARVLVVMPFGTPVAMHPGQWCGPIAPPEE